MNFTVERFGGLNCVVNNAGAGAEGDLLLIFPWKDLTEPLPFYSVVRFSESNMQSRT